MANREFHYYLNQFPLRPDSRRWWPKAIIVCATLGGLYGAAMGAAIGAVPGAGDVIQMAAAVFALICGVPGARLGSLLVVFRRFRFGRWLPGLFATIGGAILGGFLATAILLAFGAIVGALGGWLFMQAILRRFFLRRIVGGIAGAVVGLFIGAVLWAINLNRPAALAGAAWGLGIGVAPACYCH